MTLKEISLDPTIHEKLFSKRLGNARAAEEVMEKGLTTVETRDKVRGLLGKELKWRLVPIRIESAVYDRLVTIAPDGDVSQLLKQAVEKLLQGIPQ